MNNPKLFRFEFRLKTVHVVAPTESVARRTALTWANDNLASTEILSMTLVSEMVLLPKEIE